MKRLGFISSIVVVAAVFFAVVSVIAEQSSGKDSGSGEGSAAGAPSAATKSEPGKKEKKMSEGEKAKSGEVEVATIGGGCFWCTEAVLERIDGVLEVESGYMGGHVDNPTYEQICTKTTGHAEVIQVSFDTDKISFEEVLDIFWQAHDPTTLNQQGNDRGPQYRSVIFYHTAEQKNLAEISKKNFDSSGEYDDPLVTEITKVSEFWPAEEYHQDYYRLNKDTNPYCRIVISPKMKKMGFE
tara:strand:- start:121 stop:840 length:720 start_codon:yes stop_codon:yes gene_type:complete